MGKLAEAYVDITARMGGLDSGLARARGAVTGFVGFASSMFAKVGAVAGIAGAGGIAGALFAAAKKAADLAETQSKVNFVFGESSRVVNRMADDMAASFGAIKRETLDAAASFGLMAQAAGVSKAKSAELGAELVKLGLDAASFFNTSNEEAFQVLRSGLAGETEPLRRFGVLLSEAALKSEAVALGIAKTKRELTDQEKVMARISLIKKGLAPATGDLERTQDSTSNQLRKLQGELENAAADFGKDLQGALVEGIKLAKDLGEAMRKALGGASVGEAVGDTLKATATTGRVLTGETKANRAKILGLSALEALGAGGEKTHAALDREMDKVTGEGVNLEATTSKEVADVVAKARKSKKWREEQRAATGSDVASGATTTRTYTQFVGEIKARMDEKRKETEKKLLKVGPESPEFFKLLEERSKSRFSPDAVRKEMRSLHFTNRDEYKRLEEAGRAESKADIKAIDKKRKAGAEKATIKRVANLPKRIGREFKDVGKDLAGRFGKLLKGAVDKDKSVAKGNQQAILNDPLVKGLLGTGFAKLAVGAISGVQKTKQAIEEYQPIAPQMFHGAEYAQQGILSALSGDDTAKQQLDVLNKQLDVQTRTNELLAEKKFGNSNGGTGVFPR